MCRMNNKKYNRVLKTSNVSMWKFGASCILFIVLFTGLEVSVRKSNMLLPICIPWMYDYEVLFAVSIVLALIIKYLCKSKKNFLYLWLMYFWKLAVFIVMIPAVIFLTNNFYSSEESLKHCEGLIIDIQQASVGPSKTASPLRNYVKIKVDNENTSFWYDINNEPKPVGTKCILSVQKGFFGLRFVENVDFLVE